MPAVSCVERTVSPFGWTMPYALLFSFLHTGVSCLGTYCIWDVCKLTSDSNLNNALTWHRPAPLLAAPAVAVTAGAGAACIFTDTGGGMVPSLAPRTCWEVRSRQQMTEGNRLLTHSANIRSQIKIEVREIPTLIFLLHKTRMHSGVQDESSTGTKMGVSSCSCMTLPFPHCSTFN